MSYFLFSYGEYPAPPKPASAPPAPGIDLSQVDTGREDYWF